MFQNQITPLRSCVGRPIEIDRVSIIDNHAEVNSAVLNDVQILHSYLDAETKDYASFMPAKINLRAGARNRVFVPAAGFSTFATPLRIGRDFSFDPATKSALVAVLLPTSSKVDPRELFIEIEIHFESPALLGGICYYGHPFIPYTINRQGESSANYGLPREIRISCDHSTTDFIDDDNVLSLEEPISHSGVHYLGIEPVKTRMVKIRLSDWPSFLSSVRISRGRKAVYQMAYGVLIPSIIPYEFAEHTNYHPQVPFGVLACLKSGLTERQYFGVDDASGPITGSATQVEQMFAGDYFYRLSSPANNFMSFSAASITGQKRRFRSGKTSTRERFISAPLDQDEFIDLYLEQSEENNRCLSGFKIAVDATRSPSGTLGIGKVDVSVYEIDLPDGVSPVSFLAEPEKNKYLTLIYSGPIQITLASSHVLLGSLPYRFLRPSLARYLLFRLTNRSDSRRQIRIVSLDLIQSAHVSVTPRSSRVQRVESVNFRLIGETLADDYAKLGEDGFSVTVETVSAAKRKNVIFSAANLLSLLNSGNARIYSNHRRQETIRDISEEILTTHLGSNDIHTTSIDSLGWRRTETGSDADTLWSRYSNAQLTPDELSRAGSLKGEFDSYGTSETRTHNEQIGFETFGDFASGIEIFLDLIFGGRNNYPAWIRSDVVAGPRLLKRDDNNYDWESNIWNKGFYNSRNKLFVGLSSNMVLPPSALTTLAALKSELGNFAGWLKDLMRNQNFTVPPGPEFTNAIELLNSSPLVLLNGLGFGVNGGASFYVGGGISFSWSQLTPTLSHATSKGTSGNIAKQANKTGYSYAQFLNMMFDKARAVTVFEESEMKRKVERKINGPDNDYARRSGWEVMWQNKYVDIVTCKIPLSITLPASARNFYDNLDQSIRVRFGGNLMESKVEADVWFDISEETIKEDY